jgi:tRNA threonylcarbamoyl adenosine modification protein YeaZ
MTMDAGYLLAIETAVAGGSIALFDGDTYVDGRSGNVSRSETLLSCIDELLIAQGIKKSAIRELAVSLGPGSYTGIRIGIATALGLKNAFSLECIGVSVLFAMSAVSDGGTPSTCAVGMGRKGVCLQEFSTVAHPVSDPIVTGNATLVDIIGRGERNVVVDPSLYLEIRDSIPGEFQKRMVDAGPVLARLVGKAARDGFGSAELDPIFISTHQ